MDVKPIGQVPIPFRAKSILTHIYGEEALETCETSGFNHRTETNWSGKSYKIPCEELVPTFGPFHYPLKE